VEESERAAVERLVAAAEAADGVAPLSEHALLHLRRGGGIDLVRRTGDAADAADAADADDADSGGGEIVAYAHLDPATERDDGAATAELVVHPDHRRAGHGTELVHTLRARSADAGGTELRVWAHGHLPGAVGLARALDFRQVRELWQMLVHLDPKVLAELPEFAADGLRLRPFVVGQDEAAWLAVNARAFVKYPEQGGWTEADLQDREATEWFDPAGFLLAEDEATGAIAGYHWTKQHRRAAGGGSPIGEVYVLGVDPAYQGRGLGPALTLAGLRYLSSLGITEVILYVDGENAPAIATYRKLGFSRSVLDVMYAGPAVVS
jgi:mycothiol synthase